ncbi:MAG: TrpR-like protein, YerC/YecD [Ruminococcaceae bacterium]|nr:TrpR-like protein, YerC/YecD [Oscillospiraceae bacterium]MBO5040568.1 TrpR-like protein, YerC/YecD [Clostridia bacterium]
MSDKIRDEQTDFLFKAILSLSDLDECYAFFEDLCTVSEIREMAKRLTAARMLNKNYIYSDIAEKTGLSTATISRVNRCLKYGSDGYAAVIPRIEKRR